MRYALLFLFFLAACSNPYATPEVQPAAQFRGITAYAPPGDNTRVRAILSHGMCSAIHRADGDVETTNWVKRRAGQIAAALGSTAPVSLPSRPTKSYPAGRSAGQPGVHRYDVTIPHAGGTVEAVFLIWGRHVDPYRANLDYDNGRRTSETPEKPQRALLNNIGRTELMNRCLIDAVVYLGPSGNPIRHDMRHALCDILGGSFTSARPKGNPLEPATCRRPDGPGIDTVLIPESLGSTILFDAYTGLDDQRGGFFLSQRLSEIGSIYLASNQLPLLRQGTEEVGVVRAFGAGGTDSLGRFLDAVGTARAVPRAFDAGAPRFDTTELVAITDPNDVLGYRISEEVVAGTGVDLRNVLVSNAPTYFGLFSNPIEAHRNTERPQVFEIIVNGLAGQ